MDPRANTDRKSVVVPVVDDYAKLEMLSIVVKSGVPGAGEVLA